VAGPAAGGAAGAAAGQVAAAAAGEVVALRAECGRMDAQLGALSAQLAAGEAARDAEQCAAPPRPSARFTTPLPLRQREQPARPDLALDGRHVAGRAPRPGRVSGARWGASEAAAARGAVPSAGYQAPFAVQPCRRWRRGGRLLTRRAARAAPTWRSWRRRWPRCAARGRPTRRRWPRWATARPSWRPARRHRGSCAQSTAASSSASPCCSACWRCARVRARRRARGCVWSGLW